MLLKHWRSLPDLVRFMITHVADGMVMGWAFGLVLIWFDVGRIGSLLAGSNALLTALFLAKGGILFGVLHMGVAVMNLRDDG